MSVQGQFIYEHVLQPSPVPGAGGTKMLLGGSLTLAHHLHGLTLLITGPRGQTPCIILLSGWHSVQLRVGAQRS